MFRTQRKTSPTGISCKHFLGKTAEELRKEIGEPFASYNYRDGEVFLYGSAMVDSIAFHKGLAVKCNDLAETRRNVRVKPPQQIPVIIQGEVKARGQIKDISVAGTAVVHAETAIFSVGERVSITFLLTVEGRIRCMEIPCKVQDTRILDGQHVSVFLFDLTGALCTKRLIYQYVWERRTHIELGLDDSLLWEQPKAATRHNYLTS